MENEGVNGWIRDGVYYHPHLLGGVILTTALLGLSTGYFGGIKVPSLHYFGSEIFPKRRRARRRVRVYMDGCFDLMHYGHANALRQAKALGDELVVGVVSDEEIIANKGPPVLSMEERLALVSGLKWVDEVIPNAPYAITEDFMKLLFREYKIDYIIHGDDPCLLPDGSDAYALAKKAGRYKQIKRTEGVSSTDIVGRILSSSNDTLGNGNTNDPCVNGVCQGQPETHISQFLPTSRRIVQFSNGKGYCYCKSTGSGVVPFDFNKFEYWDPLKSPAPNSRVVYIDGAFDLFHAGHVEILKKARELGDFLLVGIYADQTVSEHRGKGHPIMHLHERSLSVLACRYVDEIILGAPWAITKDMITTFNISLVMHGTIAERPLQPSRSEADPYTVPKSMGIFQLLESPKDITTSLIARRIAANHEAYKKRNAKKTESEKKYYAEKKYVVDE